MSKIFVKKVAGEKAFKPDGQRLLNGSVRYRVVWEKIVPARASKETYLAAQAERDAVKKKLIEIGPAVKPAETPAVAA